MSGGMKKRMHGGFNNFGYEMRQQSTNVNGEYKMLKPLSGNLIQYAPKTFSKDLNQGPLQFEFGVSPDSEVIFSKSYFMIRPKLVVAQEPGPIYVGRTPKYGDNICYSNLLGGQLFQDVKVELANRTVALQNTQCPQVYALMNRMAYGGGFLENNKDVFYYYPDIQDRLNNNLPNKPNNMNDEFFFNSKFTLSGAPVDTMTFDIQDFDIRFFYNIGDIINFNGKVGEEFFNATIQITEMATVGVAKFKVIDGALPAANSVLQTRLMRVVQNVNSLCGDTTSTEKLICYQPPIGMFQISTGVTCNSIRITLNPYNDWYDRCVQQLLPRLSADGLTYTSTLRTYTSGTLGINNFNITIDSIQFYAYVQNRVTPMPKQLNLKTLETIVSVDTILAQGGANKQYSIPASTKYIAIFFQDANAASPPRPVYVPGTDKLIGTPLNATDFRTLDGSSSTLEYLSIQLGGLKVPQVDYTQTTTQALPGSTSLSDGQLQRYLDTQVVTAKFFSDAGSESYKNFIKSPYYLFNVEQPADSFNTTLYVRASFKSEVRSSVTSANGTAPKTYNMFVVSFYEKVVLLNQDNGLVTSIEQSEA